MLHGDRQEAVTGIRHVAGQQLVEDDAERVDVRVRVDPLAAGLLRRDVVARAEHGAGLGLPADGVERADDPEVGHLGQPLLVQEHVLRLHVAVDEALRVCERQRPPDLEAQLEHAADRQRATPGDELLQVLALDQLEDDELTAVLLTAVDHGDDVRVWSCATARASRRKRSTCSSSRPNCSCRIFSAT